MYLLYYRKVMEHITVISVGTLWHSSFNASIIHYTVEKYMYYRKVMEHITVISVGTLWHSSFKASIIQYSSTCTIEK